LAGIYELDKSLKLLKNILNEIIDDIINDRVVNVDCELMKLSK
jgi:hypothetical protein